MEKQNMIKYSVIVPVYNREKTLPRCLDSMLCQSRDDIQILVVDDGSEDDSGKIALQYARKYPCIRYVRQENRGVSAARNKGLSLAEGQYITFVDSDDYVTGNYFEILDRKPECDLLVAPFRILGQEAKKEERLFRHLQQCSSDSQRLELLLSSRRIMNPVSKRFLRSTIKEKNLHFIEGMHIGEDFNFCMAYAMQCHSIGVTADAVMCIDVSDPDSLSRKYRPDLAQKMDHVFQNVAQIIRSGESSAIRERLLSILDYLYIKNVFSSISEEFKVRMLYVFRDRWEIQAICDVFRTPLSPNRCGMLHRILRWILKLRFDWLIWFVSWAVKGRNYQSRRKR